jgi:glycosyltransferase involved in cell wall biosynthesis
MCFAGPFGQDNGDDLTTNDTEKNLTTNDERTQKGFSPYEDIESWAVTAGSAYERSEWQTHETRKKGAATPKDSQCGEKPQNTQKGAARETGNWELKTRNCREGASRLRVLWVGRMLKLKRVDTLVKACASEALKDKVELHLYGHGPEEEALKRLVPEGNNVFFHDFVPVAQVRDLMRAHDVYVFSSNASDGWGAVVSEALEEGMQVFGTVEAGASGTVLPPTHLFKAGDVKRLTELLMAELPKVAIGEWTAECAADVLQGIMNET